MHGTQLHDIPLRLWHILRLRQHQHAGLDLELVRVPQLLLFGIELLVHVLGHHVLDADEPGVGRVGVVDQALAQVFADVRAVVVGFDEARHALAGFAGVDVHGVEEFADVAEGLVVLGQGVDLLLDGGADGGGGLFESVHDEGLYG